MNEIPTIPVLIISVAASAFVYGLAVYLGKDVPIWQPIAFAAVCFFWIKLDTPR